MGIEVIVEDIKKIQFKEQDLFGDSFFGVLLQYPDTDGEVIDLSSIIKTAHDNDLLVAVISLLKYLLITKQA